MSSSRSRRWVRRLEPDPLPPSPRPVPLRSCCVCGHRERLTWAWWRVPAPITRWVCGDQCHEKWLLRSRAKVLGVGT
jgi:hypothetical protein